MNVSGRVVYSLHGGAPFRPASGVGDNVPDNRGLCGNGTPEGEVKEIDFQGKCFERHDGLPGGSGQWTQLIGLVQDKYVQGQPVGQEMMAGRIVIVPRRDEKKRNGAQWILQS